MAQLKSTGRCRFSLARQTQRFKCLFSNKDAQWLFGHPSSILEFCHFSLGKRYGQSVLFPSGMCYVWPSALASWLGPHLAHAVNRSTALVMAQLKDWAD